MDARIVRAGTYAVIAVVVTSVVYMAVGITAVSVLPYQTLAASDELRAGHRPNEAEGEPLDHHLQLRSSGKTEPLSDLGGDDNTPCLVNGSRHGCRIPFLWYALSLSIGGPKGKR